MKVSLRIFTLLRVLAALGVALLALATVPTSSAFTAKVTSGANTVTSAPYFTCRDATTAPASDYVVYPLAETAGTAATDVSGNNRTGVYSSAGVTYNQPGPCQRDNPKGAITLNGSSGSVALASAAIATPNSNVFTVGIWFRTTTTRGGKLIGLGNVATGSSGMYDRHIYMTNNGTLYFGVYPNAAKTVNSAPGYNDGTWHQAVATLSGAGMALYVDGALAGPVDRAVTTAQNYNGFVRIGYDSLNGWPGSIASFYFAGSLAYAAYYTTALTAQQVADQYPAGT